MAFISSRAILNQWTLCFGGAAPSTGPNGDDKPPESNETSFFENFVASCARSLEQVYSPESHCIKQWERRLEDTSTAEDFVSFMATCMESCRQKQAMFEAGDRG